LTRSFIERKASAPPRSNIEVIAVAPDDHTSFAIDPEHVLACVLQAFNDLGMGVPETIRSARAHHRNSRAKRCEKRRCARCPRAVMRHFEKVDRLQYSAVGETRFSVVLGIAGEEHATPAERELEDE
jgi:hypothetical protein